MRVVSLTKLGLSTIQEKSVIDSDELRLLDYLHRKTSHYRMEINLGGFNG